MSIHFHPCFSEEAHYQFGRIHLPVAPKCNIKCNYCDRRYDCASENRPGVCSKVLTPAQALVRVREVLMKDSRIKVVGIAGPRDPLANEATFETLSLVHREFPEMIKCTSTNGLLLPEKLSTLIKLGVTTLTITINALAPSVGAKIYSWISYNGLKYTGELAAELLINKQLTGLREAVAKGMIVKVNTVYIPTINAGHIPEIAQTIGKLGAYIMNIMPLIPLDKFACLQAPTRDELQKVRQLCAEFIPQFHLCRQCRADAVGVPGEENLKTNVHII